MDTAIEVEDLVVERGKRAVLHGLSCAIPAGSVTGLLGPSGSGKTTLMRAIVGVQKVVSRARSPCSGSRPGSTALRAPVGYLTQAPSVYADLTVRENARYFASLYKGVGRGRRRRGRRRGRARPTPPDQLVGDLSGGQHARASLACALVEPAARCSSSTSRPSGRTRCCATSCGTSSATRPRRARRARLQPRHGRGEPVRPAAADPRGRADRRRHPARGPRRDRHRRPRGGVPPPDPDEGADGEAVDEPARSCRAPPAGSCSQLRHDRRTIGLLIVVPVVLLTLLYYMFDDSPASVFDAIGLIMLGMFPFVIMFLITSIAMLRERTTGTLERLLTTPMGKLDLLFGYGIAFGLAAAVQASIAVGVAYWLLGLDTAGSAGLVDPDRGRQRGARGGARPVLQRLRPDRVPGRAVHAGGGGPAVAPLWTVRGPRADGRLAAGDQRCAADDVRGARRCRRSARTPTRPARSGGTSASSSGAWCWR